MADNRDRSTNSEDQTKPSGDWDKQYIAPPDASMGAQDNAGQGHTAGASASSHEYGGSATDTRVSDSRSNAPHHRDSGAEAGLMGSAYDTERQAQAGSPGSGANAPTSADTAGLNSSTGGATYSGSDSDNSVGGMLSSSDPGGVMHSGPAGGGAIGGQLGDTLGRGTVQEGSVGGAMGKGALGTSPTGGDVSGNQSTAPDSTGGTPALGDPTRDGGMMATNPSGNDNENAPDENAERVTGHRYDNDFGRSGSMGGGVMQSDSMLGPQQNRGADSDRSATSGAKPSQTDQGDDRDSLIGDRADSGGRHDNPYDQVRPTAENETPETMGGLSAESGNGDTLEGKSHLYTPGTTEEDFPAT